MMGEVIDFVLVLKVEGMHFEHYSATGIEFTVTNEGLRFVLSPTNADEDAYGHNLGLTLKIYKSYSANNDHILFVRDSIVKFMESSHDEVIRTPQICPSSIVSLIEVVKSELTSKADRLLKMLRWHQNCESSCSTFSSYGLYWRINDGNYYHIPRSISANKETTIHFPFGIHWSDEHSNDLQKLWAAKDVKEPLGHTLLREAIALALDSPRTSILMLTTALETAVKTHISYIAPETAWLMQEIPSPPIFKILRDYIPLVHEINGRGIDYWDKIKPYIKKVQKLVETRNKVAHTGAEPNPDYSLQDDIVLVTDFLYLLDVLNGHEWAKSLTSEDFRATLGWPDPKDRRVKIIINC